MRRQEKWRHLFTDPLVTDIQFFMNQRDQKSVASFITAAMEERKDFLFQREEQRRTNLRNNLEGDVLDLFSSEEEDNFIRNRRLRIRRRTDFTVRQ